MEPFATKPTKTLSFLIKLGKLGLSGFSVGYASSMASIEENSLFFISLDKLEDYPAIKTTFPLPGGIFGFKLHTNQQAAGALASNGIG